METSRQVLYKGITVPARVIETGKDAAKLVPISTNRYVLYGIPKPKNVELTKEIQAVAKEIINNSKNITRGDKQLLITYVRKVLSGPISKNFYLAQKGSPYGAVVAFLYNEKLKIGWSKRIEGDELSSGKVVPKEPLVFTKKDAVSIAVLRGITDSITFHGSGAYTEKNRIIPKIIAKRLPSFIKRVQDAFRCSVDNVVLN